VTSYKYDVVGQMTSMTDPDGVTQTTTYDQRGHVAAVTNATGGFQQTTYDAMGRQSQTTDSDGVYTSYTYDLAGELLQQSRPRSTDAYIPGYYEDRTTFTYNADGLRTSTVEPRGNIPGAVSAGFTTTVTYDADGRPVTSTDPLGRTVTTGYDAAGRPTKVTDPAGGVTTTVYNTVGWRTSVTAPSLAKTSYSYDSVGNLNKRLDPLSHATTYAYDKAGRVLTQTDALSRVTATSYDAVGNVTKVVKPSGTATVDNVSDGTASYAYDAANRLTGTTFSDATAAFSYDYSPAGRLVTAKRVQNAGVVASSAYMYDTSGRTTSTVRTGPGGGSTNYAHTSAGRLSGAAWSTGMSAAYSYNSVGELTTVTPSGAGNVPTVDYGYDSSGRMSTVTREGVSPPTSTAVLYDSAGQLTSLTHSAASSVVDGYDVTRDSRGNPTKVTTTAAGASTSALYGYDAVSRLTSECYPTTGGSCTSAAPKTSYSYDKVGNRKVQSARTVTGTTASTVSTAYTYDAADELLSQSVAGVPTMTNTWTPNGALASSTTSTGTKTFTTDLTDELVSAVSENGSTVSYTHDTKGNRTSRSLGGVAEATWAWDDLTSLPVRTGEYDQTGALTTAWLPDPTSTTGASLAESSGGVSSWLLSDPFANITAAVSTTGSTVSGARSLNAFGAARAQATGSLAASAIGFAGQYLESATGLYDMRARDYDPASGRFTANDPVAVPTGMPYMAGYSYAFNNPLTGTDASGNWSSNCGAFSQACDSYLFFANEIIGAAKVVVGIASAIAHPELTVLNLSVSCYEGFAKYGGNGPSFEGFLQCVDNLNPIAEIGRQFSSSLSATNVQDSGQAFGQGLLDSALVAAPFAKGIARAPADCATADRGSAGANAGRVFSSADPYVADAANAIERAFPGRVQGVNSQIHMTDGLSREVDVDLGNMVVQVKSGNARGLTGQLQKTTSTTGLPAIGYAPDIPNGAWEAAARQGIRIARSPDELVAIVKELGR
jgi:RHS repeat-associated protein